MGAPYPPAPTKAASVAVPMLTMVAVLIPASTVGLASGSTMRKRICLPVKPKARAFSRCLGSTLRMPVKVLSTTGSRLYMHSAASAGLMPTPNSGMRKHSSASEGTV